MRSLLSSLFQLACFIMFNKFFFVLTDGPAVHLLIENIHNAGIYSSKHCSTAQLVVKNVIEYLSDLLFWGVDYISCKRYPCKLCIT